MKTISKQYNINIYMQNFWQKFESAEEAKLGSEKMLDHSRLVLKCSEYKQMLRYNYSGCQLKTMAVEYNLKKTGTKPEMFRRVFSFLKLTYYATKIQSLFRKCIYKKYRESRGPAYFNRKICTNDSDFLSGEALKDIPNVQFISFKDDDTFVYGFDILSLYHLMIKSDEMRNPYNRNVIPEYVIKNMKHLIKTNKKINLKLDDGVASLSLDKKIELLTLDLFQKINLLGNYSNPKWFLSLNKTRLVHFVGELMDIWYYRAQITPQEKHNISPDGSPFRHISLPYIKNEEDIRNIQTTILIFLERFITKGLTKESRALSACYVLGALTIVNKFAAEELPWLFQSFSH